MSPLPEPLRALAEAWLDGVRAPRRRAIVAGFCLVFTIAMFVARIGTIRARVAAFGILAAALGAIVAIRVIDRRVFADPAKTIARVAGHAEPELAARATRALSLRAADGARGTSRELADLHVQRTLAALPIEAVDKSAARLGFLFGVVALGLAATNIASCAVAPWGGVEGFDVLLARNGEAPIGMAWLADPQIRARPPDYLHMDERKVMPYEDVALPRGTLLTYRGMPVHNGRRLLLTDGDAEVPFVDDGSGHVVARWPLAETVKLRVVARFGGVVVPESQETPVESIPDKAPIVTLEGAPKRIVLASEEDASEIPIHYDATDDHGLREVHLVLRAGAREERRVLARLDGETKVDRGGYQLRATDAFIKKSHAPVEIRVEAKDNDPITGPKWGASDAITVVPPDVGEPEAKRLAALAKLRDQFVDSLAWRLGNAVPGEMKARRDFLDHEAKLDQDDGDALDVTLSGSYAGTRIGGRLAAMLRGRYRKVKEAVTNQARSPSTAAHATLIKATERIVLVVDAVVRGQALKDTREVARELADVADELSSASTLAQSSAERPRGIQRIDAAVMVLQGGGRSMKHLGSLGRDLGEIVEMDLSRFDRVRKVDDLLHAVLVAQDLAARLRQPDPSFGARGGRPSHAGGESGGGGGADGAEPEGNDVEQAFNEAAQELEKLASDHNGQIGKTEQAIANGSTKEDLEQLSEDAKKHAQRVRDAVKPLPNVGGGSDSWTSKGAAAREHAEQMAKALEEGNAADAVQSGRSALGALDEAKRAAQREKWSRFGDPQAEKSIDDAKRTVEQELKWSEDKLDELRKRAARRAAPELRGDGEEEGKLADRTRDLAKKGRDEDVPSPALDALHDAEQSAREAARALQEGDAEKGLVKQREAQQKLEQAKEALGEENDEGESGGKDDDGRSLSNSHADIPKAEQHKGPEEFRRRVIKGLGQPSGGRLKDAVKRYAEGLLR